MNKIIRDKFDLFAEWVGDNLGKPVAFALALSCIVLWASFGPLTGFSQTWQLIVNTGTTIATFLMVFLLQNTQNRDTTELKLYLRELRDAQRNLLEVQRRLGERIMVLEYEVDKKRHIA